jgi:hypothetical protein
MEVPRDAGMQGASQALKTMTNDQVPMTNQ